MVKENYDVVRGPKKDWKGLIGCWGSKCNGQHPTHLPSWVHQRPQ